MIAMFSTGLLVFCAVWCAVRALADVAGGSGAAARLSGGAGGFCSVADDIVYKIGPLGVRWRMSRIRAAIEGLVSRAGKSASCTAESVALASIMSAVAMSCAIALFAPLLVPVVFCVGLALPAAWLFTERTRLVRDVTSQLPFVIELLAIAVDAGMDFMTAMQRVAEKAKPGPLRTELQLMLQAVRLGSPRADALHSFSDRLDVASLQPVVSALIQADRLGTPISSVLKEQADFLRFERLQRAEQMGAVASQKILLPVALLILPAFLLLTLGSVLLGVAVGGNGMFAGGGL